MMVHGTSCLAVVAAAEQQQSSSRQPFVCTPMLHTDQSCTAAVHGSMQACERDGVQCHVPAMWPTACFLCC